MKEQKHTVYIEELDITIATGTLAKQAGGAVTIQAGETSVFVSATMANDLRPDQDYFPLMVDYREKFAAAGRFPGGYFKREGRPSEKEILTSRLCDRPLRPLFPKGFMNEVQIIGMLLSTDLMNEPDVLMVNGASAALMCSDIPFNGPVACVRVAEINGEFVVNPTNEQLFESRLDLIYVGNEKNMLMIEGSADQLTEERFIEALEYAHEKIQKIVEAQRELASKVNKTKRTYDVVEVCSKMRELCEKHAGTQLNEVLYRADKGERTAGIRELKKATKKTLEAELGDDFDKSQMNMSFDAMQEEIVRKNVLDNEKRLDGRGMKDVRRLECMTGVIPRVHGSSVFERGETQAMVVTTLGTSRDSQDLDALTGGAQSKSFILHYNFPPFSVGETGRFGFTSRREQGHGALAERSLLPIVPPEDEFPYTIRLVSEILESNGSSSMASICGGCLALMDAGVPILAPVAGISAGLFSEHDANEEVSRHKVLTDILGDEDHFGDMDFKIAGTREGITGFQLDLKIKGLPIAIAKEAIAQCREARLSILDKMAEALEGPRKELKDSAPRVHRLKIDPEKIGALIGPGGKNIKRITELTGADIDINEDNSGEVNVFCADKAALDRAIEEIEMTVGEIEVGVTYRGIVKSVREFGAFVECIPGKDGLVHVSEMAEVRVENPDDVCKEGDEMTVKCIGVDSQGRVRLSRKAVICEAKGIPYEPTEAPRSRGGDSRGGDRRGGGGRDGDRRGGDRRGGDRGGDRRDNQRREHARS